jgi:hypothetical protein
MDFFYIASLTRNKDTLAAAIAVETRPASVTSREILVLGPLPGSSSIGDFSVSQPSAL